MLIHKRLLFFHSVKQRDIFIFLQRQTPFFAKCLESDQHCYLPSSINNFKFTGAVIPGAGAYEIAAHAALTILRESVSTRARLGVQVSNIHD